MARRAPETGRAAREPPALLPTLLRGDAIGLVPAILMPDEIEAGAMHHAADDLDDGNGVAVLDHIAVERGIAGDALFAVGLDEQRRELLAHIRRLPHREAGA